MRRAANKLQLDLAHNDWTNAVRSLHIYYGLNSMVRPSLMGTYAQLHNTKNPFAAIQCLSFICQPDGLWPSVRAAAHAAQPPNRAR